MTHHLLGTTEVAALLGLSRQRVHQLATDDPDFPAPAVRLAAGPVWERAIIETWAERTGRKVRGDAG